MVCLHCGENVNSYIYIFIYIFKDEDNYGPVMHSEYMLTFCSMHAVINFQHGKLMLTFDLHKDYGLTQNSPLGLLPV